MYIANYTDSVYFISNEIRGWIWCKVFSHNSKPFNISNVYKIMGVTNKLWTQY